jgi:hypothetical protein
MKKLNLYTYRLVLLPIVFLLGCDKGFDELNINKTAATSINPAYLLNNAIIRANFSGSTLPYEHAIVQQIVTPNGGVQAGANFNQDNRVVTQGLWQQYYRDVLKHTVDVLNKTRNDANRTNLHNMARIWRAFAGMILTDTYGDVPFSQAGLGYLQSNVSPKYDSQQEIYQEILKELEEATAALDVNSTIETSDVLYGGNITKWKRFGYSLMLRAAMRHTKVDPSIAQQYTSKAIAGGLMQSNEDNSVLRLTAFYPNNMTGGLTTSESANFYLTSVFVDFLKTNNDPRLAAIAVRYVGAKSGAEQLPARASKDPALQIGMPMGYDNGTIVPVAQSSGLASFYDYSQVDRTRMAKNTSPVFLVTYAQTGLLYAEALQRGWAQGDISAVYENAVRGHMEQMGQYDPSSNIDKNAIDAYMQAQPFDQTKALEQINTQYWVASFLNGPEAFANFRRSSYPNLPPNPYPGKEINGTFIRRLTYPDSELSVNSGKVQEAISRQGPDNLDTRVWWDK